METIQVHAQIAAIASTVRDSGDGQGVFYHADTRTVYWSGGDSDFAAGEEHGMTQWEPVRDALLALEDVDSVELHAESGPLSDDPPYGLLPGWQRVSYSRSRDVQAWDRWFMIEVLGCPVHIVDDVIREAGGEILPYPDGCEAIERPWRESNANGRGDDV